MPTADVARSYHDRTKHTWRTVRSGGRALDWSNQPVPFKLYPDLEPLPLPVDLAESDWPALDALVGEGPPNRQPLDIDRLAALLFYSAGVTRRWERDGRQLNFRAAPSAGALYPTELYVVCRDLPGLDAGLYHFEPLEFCLRKLRDGDLRGTLAGATQDAEVGRAPLSIVATGIAHRTTWKYRDRGYRHLLWDAGTVLAHVLSLAEAMAEPARVVTGFVDRDLSHLLGLDDEEELTLAIVPFGELDAAGPRAGVTVDHLPHRMVPVSRRRVEQPELLALHRVADLRSAPEVVEWRAAMRDLRLERAVDDAEPPLLAAFDTLEEVVLRRGSTRRFARAGVPHDALVWPLSVAARAAPMDVLRDGDSLLRHHVVVHAVEGVEPGAYRWTAGGAQLLRPGSFRGEATSLCLEQPLGGEGAYTAFHLADLDQVLSAGERAYRAVQLEAGIAAGRLQLAAAALGIGATGLTFYDDDVVRFFDGGGEPMMVTAVGLPAYDPVAGRRPSDAPAVRLQRPA